VPISETASSPHHLVGAAEVAAIGSLLPGFHSVSFSGWIELHSGNSILPWYVIVGSADGPEPDQK
jgi:hypothetical protein